MKEGLCGMQYSILKCLMMQLQQPLLAVFYAHAAPMAFIHIAVVRVSAVAAKSTDLRVTADRVPHLSSLQEATTSLNWVQCPQDAASSARALQTESSHIAAVHARKLVGLITGQHVKADTLLSVSHRQLAAKVERVGQAVHLQREMVTVDAARMARVQAKVARGAATRML